MMKNRNYKMVSAFTKPPILLRKRIFQIMLFGLFFCFIWAVSYEIEIFNYERISFDTASSIHGIYFLQIQR